MSSSSPSDEGRLVRSMTSVAEVDACMGVVGGGLDAIAGGLKGSGATSGETFGGCGLER